MVQVSNHTVVGFQPTYEELKLKIVSEIRSTSAQFSAYLRGIETV